MSLRETCLLWSLKYAGSSIRSRRRVVNGVALKCCRPSDKLISSSCRTARNRARRRRWPWRDESRSSRAHRRRWRNARSRTPPSLRCTVDRWTGPLTAAGRHRKPTTAGNIRCHGAARAHWSDAARRRIFLTTVCLY